MTHELVVRRVIAAPAARLFDAWTTPEALLAWFGPRDVRCIAAEVDLRVGGGYRLGNELADGRVLWIAGTFEQVERPTKLVYSWQIGSEPASRVTVQFAPITDDRTEVIVVHERIEDATTRDDHQRGWVGCLDSLAEWSERPGDAGV
jgi:uncharacterized protein YndB with AHSA1/START domain